METIKVETKKKQEIVNITNLIEKIVEKESVVEGICCVYVKHATAAIIINENFDPSVCDDILTTLNKLIPEHANYKHDAIDNNAASHIKSSILSPSVCIPVRNKKLELGRWQGIGLVELDGPRTREIVVEVVGNVGK